MHKNSLETWRNEVEPTLRKRQLQVLKVYQGIPSGTATDIMNLTGQPRNVIQPRIGELAKLKYLEEIGDKIINGRKHGIYRVTDQGRNTDTSKVASIVPANKYYSKEDYRHFARDFYDYMKRTYGLPEDKNSELYKDLRDYVSGK